MANMGVCEEVFVMAMEMEKVAKDFYEALALASDDVKVRRFCARVYGEEARHYDTFRKMRDEFAQGGQSHGVTPEMQEDLRELVKGQVQPSAEQVYKVAISGILADALEMAMRMERDSISFYRGLSTRLPATAPTLQQIVKEETGHLAALRNLAGMA